MPANILFKMGIILIPKSDKGYQKERRFQMNIPYDLDSEILNKMLANKMLQKV